MTPLLSNPLLRAQSDDRLAELAAAGHDRAFEAIVERYRRPLARYLRRLLSEPLAEDVLQATFVRAWQALGSGTEVRELRPWLYRIAHNQAVNALRAAGAALPAAAEEPIAASTETEVEARDELRRTLAGIGTLPDRQRAALVAIAVADRAHADVAAELGLSDGALRQLLLRARTALRTAATALTPYPLVSWLSAGQEIGASRVAEVAAGAGGIGVGVKAGAAVLAAGALVAGAPALRDEHAAKVTEPTSTPRHVATRKVAAEEDRAPTRTVAARAAAAPVSSHKSSTSGSGSKGPSRSSGGGSGDDSRGRSGSSGPGSGDDGADHTGSGGSDDAVEHSSSGPSTPKVSPTEREGDDDGGESGGDRRSNSSSSGEGGDDGTRFSGSGSGESESSSSGSGGESSGPGSDD
jgi:RNA polymerase sigma factor (sigma-70 family)